MKIRNPCGDTSRRVVHVAAYLTDGSVRRARDIEQDFFRTWPKNTDGSLTSPPHRRVSLPAAFKECPRRRIL